MSNLLKKDKGFTLIEIVLVLAIAGLLLVIVFLAVSGAQKARRDSQRKNDASRMAAQVENYAGNNNGLIPADQPTIDKVIGVGSNYFNTTTDKDPSGNTYTVKYTAVAPAAAGGVSYTAGSLCPSSSGTATTRSYELQIYLEQGGSFCVDNH